MTHDPNNKGVHVPTPCPECRSLVGHNYNCSRLNNPADEVDVEELLLSDPDRWSWQRRIKIQQEVAKKLNKYRSDIDTLRLENKKLVELVGLYVDPTGMDEDEIELVLKCVDRLEQKP